MPLGWKQVSTLGRRPRSIRGSYIATVVAIALAVIIAGFVITDIWQNGWPQWGTSQRKITSSQITETDANSKTTTTVTTIEPRKTIWDWLSLLGVPVVLALLGFWFQRQQQERASEAAEEQRAIAADETREEALQIYLDRLSTLLVDKNILAIATKLNDPNKQGDVTPEQQELYEAAIDIIRARTLSILQRFETDIERKSSVVRLMRWRGASP